MRSHRLYCGLRLGLVGFPEETLQVIRICVNVEKTRGKTGDETRPDARGYQMKVEGGQ